MAVKPPPAKSCKTTKLPAAPRRSGRRLSPAEREQHILREAISFFAEVGFGGQTRELAERIGVTQPLLYRYFPTKQHMIDRVYQEVYLRRWDPAWEELLADRSLGLRERLVRFYQQYTTAIFTYEWMRIYMFAGLKGAEINQRYIKRLEERILARICRELRAEFGYPAADGAAPTGLERELVWMLHGGIYYYGVRKYVYEIPVESDLETLIQTSVDALLQAAPAMLGRILGAARPVAAGAAGRRLRRW